MSTCSANATGLPKNVIPFPSRSGPDGRNFLPLDADMVDMLSADAWEDVGRTLRLALVGFRLGPDDWADAVGNIIDDDPHALDNILEAREKHRKVLQKALALIRAADRRDNRALDRALTARGH